MSSSSNSLNSSVTAPSSPTTTTYVNRFLFSFGELKNEIENQLTNCSSDDFLQNGCITNNLSKLERELSVAATFLPTYTCKVSQESLDTLRKMINMKRSATMQRRKFTFGLPRKSTSSDESSPSVSNSSSSLLSSCVDDSTRTTGHTGSRTSSCAISSGDEESASDSSTSYSTSLPSSLEYFKSIKAGMRNLNGKTIHISRDDINGIDYELESLKNCSIYLPGSPCTLYLTQLTDCIINCGPIPTSIYVDSCNQCTLALATQQLRVYGCNNCTFTVDVKSKPIIEDCSQLYFGKYNYYYDEIHTDYISCDFDDTSDNCYNQVVDFNWLSSTPSPNWSVIESPVWVR